MTKALSLTLFEIFMVIISIANAQGLRMPTCMSNCMTHFSANHEPDLCTAPWIQSITTCIDSACSTTSNSSSYTAHLAVSVLTNISLTFVPKVQYDCEQSDVPGFGDEPAPTALLVTEGQCVESPYKFLSFLPTYIDDAAMLDCQLQLFAESGCDGEVTNLTMSDVDSGKCFFESGKSVRLACGRPTDVATDRAAKGQSDNTAAHAYLDWLCNINSTTTVTASSSDTATRSTFTATTGMAKSTLPTCGNANTTCANTSVNGSTTSALSATPTLHVIPETGLSRAERIVGRQETAQLALVVAIFARNVLL